MKSLSPRVKLVALVIVDLLFLVDYVSSMPRYPQLRLLSWASLCVYVVAGLLLKYSFRTSKGLNNE